MLKSTRMAVLATISALAVSACATTSPEPAPAQGEAEFEALMAAMMARRSPLAPDELAARIEAAQAFPLGSFENPVRTDGPTGQQEYLARLRCSNGRMPRFERTGNLGRGIYDSIVDAYVVDCLGAQPGEVRVIMDMYHAGHREREPIAGFTMAGAQHS